MQGSLETPTQVAAGSTPDHAYATPYVRPVRSSNAGTIILVFATVAFLGVAIFGVVAGMAYYGTRRHAGEAKALEGKVLVEELALHEQLCGDFAKTLPPSAGPIPGDITHVTGTKYVATSAEWAAFDCATTGAKYAPPTHFEILEPAYFQYEWERETPTDGVARAVADLDGDGKIDIVYEVAVTCTAGRCSREVEPRETRNE